MSLRPTATNTPIATPLPPTPTLALTPLAKPTAAAFDLNLRVGPDEFTVVNFCRAESVTRSTCVREQRELEARPEEVYTIEAWEAIRISLKLAKRLNHSKAAPEHLLYGLLVKTDGSVARLLGELGANLPLVLTQLQEALLDMPWTSASSRELYPDVGPDLTPVAVDSARKQAARMNAQLISPEHLLLAILEAGPSAGSRILKEMGITTNVILRTLER